MTAFKLHVMACGHGDTLLLQMPKRKWALIDCHLPGNDARARFFKYADSLGIRRLEYIVLTHPDSDHYKGMRQVLERYASNGRAIGYFCAPGGSPTHVMKLLESRGLSDDDVEEYAALFRTVNDLRNRRLLKRHALNDQVATIRITGKRKGFSIVAVGPDYDRLASAEDAALAKISHQPMNANDCSVVLVAQYVSRFASHRFFLRGDMVGAGLTQALARWDGHSDNIEKVRTFDLVKAAHHGSKNGHDLAVAARIARKGSSVVVVSCGTLYNLPSRNVLADYLANGWKVFCTSPRTTQGKPRSALQATSRGASATFNPLVYDICVTAGRFGGLSATPAAAQIQVHQLAFYK